MRKIQSQGVHHITICGADRQTSIDFWEGVLGMPFIFEQPNLDNEGESHLYFDPGDGRLITAEPLTHTLDRDRGLSLEDILLDLTRDAARFAAA